MIRLSDRILALEQCLEHGWIPQYIGTGVQLNYEQKTNDIVLLYENVDYRCQAFYTFKSDKEYQKFLKKYGNSPRINIGWIDKLIIRFLIWKR